MTWTLSPPRRAPAWPALPGHPTDQKFPLQAAPACRSWRRRGVYASPSGPDQKSEVCPTDTATLVAVIPERLRPLVDETAAIASRFQEAGFQLYLVGGIVRDAVTGRLREDSDLDFTTDARPDGIERLVKGW